MPVKTWLKNSTQILEQAGIGTARLDCLVLLEDATNKDRGWLLSHPEFELSDNQVKKLNAQIKLRTTHEPLAYIRNVTEFYGRAFFIDHRVLEPRPESETMIELLKAQKLPSTPTIVDLGSGSGALAITAKLELPAAKVIATDIDPLCLEVTEQNAQKFHANITCTQGNLLEPLKTERAITAILANLPYVPDHFQINPAAMAEPRIAIFGGPDGLELYRSFFTQLKKLKSKPLLIFTECMPPQHEALATIADRAGFALLTVDDFIQLFTPKS
jgi:release factor glutamine methyltransferase